ncbi:hypothetical protein [Vibrio furnissii]|uniref:hypothetical protein n=1 Tax=Vibrio furnissii TaxID=29494 RepID=UPI002574053C|nr:hypothetical protein [Vibrio furnissii]WJG22084.1 hypothetical protein QSU95_02650 [Vibrio furnissii]
MLQILIYRLVLALLALNQRQQHQLCQRKFHHWLSTRDHLQHDIALNAASALDECQQQSTARHRRQLRAVIRSLKPCGC